MRSVSVSGLEPEIICKLVNSLLCENHKFCKKNDSQHIMASGKPSLKQQAIAEPGDPDASMGSETKISHIPHQTLSPGRVQGGTKIRPSS